MTRLTVKKGSMNWSDEDVLEQLEIMAAGWRGRQMGDREAFAQWWQEELERLWAIAEAVLSGEEADDGEGDVVW